MGSGSTNDESSASATQPLVSSWIDTGLYQVAPSLAVAVSVNEHGAVGVTTTGLDAYSAVASTGPEAGFHNCVRVSCSEDQIYEPMVDASTNDPYDNPVAMSPISGLNMVTGGYVRTAGKNPVTVTALTFTAAIDEKYGTTTLRTVHSDQFVMQLSTPLVLRPVDWLKKTDYPKTGSDGATQKV